MIQQIDPRMAQLFRPLSPGPSRASKEERRSHLAGRKKPAARVAAERSAPFLRLGLAIYDGLWAPILAVWWLLRWFRRNSVGMDGVVERLGWVPIRPRWASESIWIHAVSIGELLSIRPLLSDLKKEHPDWWVLLSTSNAQAYDLARKKETDADAVCLAPFDFGPSARLALDRAAPSALAIVECELWPNLIIQAADAGVSILMINARLYGRDFPRYLRASRIFRPLLRQMKSIGAQTAADAERFLRLGADPASVAITGNTKFDVKIPAQLAERLQTLRRILPLSGGPLWVLASTHEDEEEQILTSVGPLRKNYPDLQILIAPRHVTRGERIRELAESRGLQTWMRSHGLPGEEAGAGARPPDVLILDSIGELANVLAFADLVFIGGTLVDRGGQNPIEAGLLAKPMIIGPTYYNFEEVVAAFRAENALVVVQDAEELTRKAAELLADAPGRRELGMRAARVIATRSGATSRALNAIRQSVLGAIPPVA